MTPEQKLELEERRLEAALKKLKEKPNALLFLETECHEWDFDIPKKICGLPVYYSGHLINETYRRNQDYQGIPWVPMWSKSCHIDNIHTFNATYIEKETHGKQ